MSVADALEKRPTRKNTTSTIEFSLTAPWKLFPEAAAFLAARRKLATCDAYRDDMPEDVNLVSSGGLAPLFPGNDDN